MAEVLGGGFTVSTMDDAIKTGNIKQQIVFSDDVTMEWEQIPSVSNTIELDLASSDASFRAAAIGWSGTTTVTIAAKTLTLSNLENETEVYKRTLESKWAGKNMNHLNGSGLEPYQALIQGTIIDPLKEEYKKALWVDGTSGF